MVRCYDNWEKLVEAVMRREQLRQLSLSDSRSPSTRSFDSDSSFTSRDDYLSSEPTPFHLHPDAVKLKLAKSFKEGKHTGRGKLRRYAIWKGLPIFSGFSSKKDVDREERQAKWAGAQRTFHGLEPLKFDGLSSKLNYEQVSRLAEERKRKEEMARLREAYTLKGQFESVLKAKGLDINSIHHHYTV